MFNNAKAFVLYVSPFVLLVLPFLKGLISKATTGESASWGDFARKLASRVILLFAASVVPLLLWLAMMQLAYWGTEIAQCPGIGGGLDCDRKDIMRAGWPHAPAFLQWYFEKTAYWRGAFLSFAIAAAALFLFWPILSVNSNSLHQLYRDRLGQAFLIKRKTNGTIKDEIDYADDFKLSKIDAQRAPYHLINTALNVPGSKFANRRGRNADFFVFSQLYIGSEATGYVETRAAEVTVDGLNIGTAMAISGAAAAPNMGMASIRPLSPTIALLNVRLGRWIRHPLDIFNRNAKLEAEKEKKQKEAKGKEEKGKEEKQEEGERQFWRIPRPRHLLYEAFSKTGVSVEQLDAKALKKRGGFVFLTDGGHIDNLGVYELLRRRCKLIIAIDGEADPDFDSGSLVQVERFARIDMNVIIKLNWEPIGIRTQAVTNEIKNGQLKEQPGPHVALGSISYPPLTPGGEREKGALIYIKASLSGDESDYVIAYKKANPRISSRDDPRPALQRGAVRSLPGARRTYCAPVSRWPRRRRSLFRRKGRAPEDRERDATGGYGEIDRRDCGPKIHGSTDGLPGQPTPGSTIDRPINPNPNVRPRIRKQGGSRGGQRTRNLRMRRAGGGLRLRRHVGGGHRGASRPQRPHCREGAALRRHHRALRRLALDSRHLAGARLGHRRKAPTRRGPICGTRPATVLMPRASMRFFPPVPKRWIFSRPRPLCASTCR